MNESREPGARSQEKSDSMLFMLKALLFLLTSSSRLLAPCFRLDCEFAGELEFGLA
jgi:hypothetical protein